MQTTNSNQNEESGKTPEDLIGVLLIIVVAIGLALWLGAQSASFFNSGSLLPPNPEGIGAILWNTVTEHPGDPASAWPEPHRSQLPGAWLYWPDVHHFVCNRLDCSRRTKHIEQGHTGPRRRRKSRPPNRSQIRHPQGSQALVDGATNVGPICARHGRKPGHCH